MNVHMHAFYYNSFSCHLMLVPKPSVSCKYFIHSFIIRCSWTAIPLPDTDFCCDVPQGSCVIDL